MSTSSYACGRCGARHDRLEIGFRLPDAAFALALADEERAAFAALDDPDSLQVHGAGFVRGVALFRMEGPVDDIFGIGFWAQLLAPDALRDFHEHARREAPHAAYRARIANQAAYFGPTLGIEARVEYAGPGLRPRIVLNDRVHALARAQNQGKLADDVVTGWLADQQHLGEAGPPTVGPTVAHLARDGWELLSAEDVGRAPLTADGWQARPGDLVKVAVRWLAADVRGDVTPLVAAVWARIDVVGRDDGWLGGVLDNHLRVPGTIDLGARLWFAVDAPFDLQREG